MTHTLKAIAIALARSRGCAEEAGTLQGRLRGLADRGVITGQPGKAKKGRASGRLFTRNEAALAAVLVEMSDFGWLAAATGADLRTGFLVTADLDRLKRGEPFVLVVAGVWLLSPGRAPQPTLRAEVLPDDGSSLQPEFAAYRDPCRPAPIERPHFGLTVPLDDLRAFLIALEGDE